MMMTTANDATLTGLVSLGPPFTVCNILCIGNTMGIVTLFPVFRDELTLEKAK